MRSRLFIRIPPLRQRLLDSLRIQRHLCLAEAGSQRFASLQIMVYAGSKTLPISYSTVMPMSICAVMGSRPYSVLQPARHLGGGVLQRLVERTRVARGEDVRRRSRRAATRCAAASADQRERHFAGDLDAGAHDLARALHGVAVAQAEERAGNQHREIDRDAGAKAAVIHVAAVLCGGRCGDRLAVGGGHAKAAQHRRERQRERAQRPLRCDQRRRAGCGIDRPLGVAPFALWRPRQVATKSGIHHVGRQERAAPAIAAVGRDALDVDHQRVARRRALDKEGTGHRVARRRDLLAVLVVPVRVHRGGDDAVARRNPQHRRMAAQGVVVVSGCEVVLVHGCVSVR
jgi:hypothetical protein